MRGGAIKRKPRTQQQRSPGRTSFYFDQDKFFQIRVGIGESRRRSFSPSREISWWKCCSAPEPIDRIVDKTHRSTDRFLVVTLSKIFSSLACTRALSKRTPSNTSAGTCRFSSERRSTPLFHESTLSIEMSRAPTTSPFLGI